MEIEADGLHFKVRLEWVPRIGEIIELHSAADKADYRYEVRSVIHQLRHIGEDAAESQRGEHWVIVHVQHAEDESGEPDIILSN
jgi:hypothetical protein